MRRDLASQQHCNSPWEPQSGTSRLEGIGKPRDPVHMSTQRGAAGSPAAAAIVGRARVSPEGSRGRSPLAHGSLSRTRGRCSEYTVFKRWKIKRTTSGVLQVIAKNTRWEGHIYHGLPDPSIRENQNPSILGRQVQARHPRAPAKQRQPRPEG